MPHPAPPAERCQTNNFKKRLLWLLLPNNTNALLPLLLLQVLNEKSQGRFSKLLTRTKA
jgi:hypothetical protein